MKLKTLLFGKTYAFRDVKDVLAKANEPKSGDRLAGLAAESAQERVAAKAVLAELLLRDLRENPAVPYEQDEVTRIIQDDLNERIYAEMQNWTVSDLREWILSETTTTADLRRASRGLTSEMVAAVCKLMSDLDLIYAARKIPVTAHCNTTIGLPVPLSAFAGEPSQNIGKSFIKSYSAVCLEGAIIVLACIIFSLFASSPPVVDPDAAAVTQVWSYVGELVFNMLVLVGAVKMADRVVREMMGL